MKTISIFLIITAALITPAKQTAYLVTINNAGTKKTELYNLDTTAQIDSVLFQLFQVPIKSETILTPTNNLLIIETQKTRFYSERKNIKANGKLKFSKFKK